VLRGVATLRSLLRRAEQAPTPPWGATFPLLLTEHVHAFVFTRTVQLIDHPALTNTCLPPAAQTHHQGSPDRLWTGYRATLDLIDQTPQAAERHRHRGIPDHGKVSRELALRFA